VKIFGGGKLESGQLKKGGGGVIGEPRIRQTYGRVAMDSEESDICSRCRSSKDILANFSFLFFSFLSLVKIDSLVWIASCRVVVFAERWR
jgi:hypothetical protein